MRRVAGAVCGLPPSALSTLSSFPGDATSSETSPVLTDKFTNAAILILASALTEPDHIEEWHTTRDKNRKKRSPV